MPPKKIPSPEFTPVGRYLLNVDERRIEGPTYFHDTENLTDLCEVVNIPTGSMSRFNNKAWAVQRGYTACEYCR